MEARAAKMNRSFDKFKPEEISELLNQSSGNLLGGSFVGFYQNYLAELNDIDRLVKSLALLNSADYKNYLLRSFGLSYGKASPLEALRWANALPDVFGQDKVQVLVYAYGYLAKTDPKAASEQLALITDQKARDAIQALYPVKVR